MAVYTAKDCNAVSWSEFDQMIDDLMTQIRGHFGPDDQGVNVITPLLRTGGIVGGVLAIKMRVVTMLPVQFKYTYHPTEIKQILSVPDILETSQKPLRILLCEGNTSSGSIATRAAAVIKAQYPSATIYLATLTKVFGGPDRLPGIDHIFYARMTNEKFLASADDINLFKIRPGITIFPWERIEDELADMNA